MNSKYDPTVLPLPLPLPPPPQHQHAPNNTDYIEKYTASLCQDITRLFRHHQRRNNNNTNTSIEEKQGLIAKARRWVDRMSKLEETTQTRHQHQQQQHCSIAKSKCDGRNNSKCQRMAVTDALIMLLRSLDDVDVQNLSSLYNNNNNNSNNNKTNKRKIHQQKKGPPSTTTCTTTLPTTTTTTSQNKKIRRKRLPSNVRSTDIIQAIHEAEDSIESDNEEEEEGVYNSQTFHPSNSDRHQRATKQRLQMESRSQPMSCSMMGISLKAVMKAQIPKDTVAITDKNDDDDDDDDAQGILNYSGNGRKKEHLITTLTHEAAVLRRDLYKLLSVRDVADIRVLIPKKGKSECKNDCGAEGQQAISNNSDDDATLLLPTKIKHLIPALFRRIASNPTSPSMRLSAIIALDSLREMELSDGGYRCVLEELLLLLDDDDDANDDSTATWSLKFYAEIVSECNVYETPVRLLPRLSELLQRALKARKKLVSSSSSNDSSSNASTTEEVVTIHLLLRTISHIMVRRQSILAGIRRYRDDDDLGSSSSLLLRREIDTYKRLCSGISVRYDSTTNWISQNMPNDERENVISALQAEGILSLFCCDESDDDEDQRITSSTSLSRSSPQVVERFPYPYYSSLRAAHDRMGPCDGFNRLVSHPAAYEHNGFSTTLPDSSFSAAGRLLPNQLSSASSPLSNAHDDILEIIFSYLGYRSLSRASQCCNSWKRAGGATTLWVTLYFRKYRQSYFEEELAFASKDNAYDDDAHFGKFRSLHSAAERQKLAVSFEGGCYDWNYMFKTRYVAEKRNRSKKLCNVIGCSYVNRRADHAASHRKRHESAVQTQRRKQAAYKALQLKVSKLRQQRIVPESPAEDTILRVQKEIDSPESVLKHLVFPYLDFKDVVKPVCKLWTGIAKCNMLWESLYLYDFGMPNTRFESPSTDYDWKMLFQTAFLAHCKVRGQTNMFGWKVRICPVLGCNKELRSKLECDTHLLKHKEAYCLNYIKQTQKKHRDQKRLSSKKKGVAEK